MADDPGYTLDGDSVDALVDLLQRDESAPRSRIGVPGSAAGVSSQRVVTEVRITSLTKTGNFWPGRWAIYDASTDTRTDQADVVWVRAINGGTLALSTYYRATADGYNGGQMVFSVDDGVGTGAAGSTIIVGAYTTGATGASFTDGGVTGEIDFDTSVGFSIHLSGGSEGITFNLATLGTVLGQWLQANNSIYDPANDANWAAVPGPPATVGEALDRIAARLAGDGFGKP